MLCAQELASGDGLANATCATLGISTTVAADSERATSGPNDDAIWPSYCADMTRVGMPLFVTSRIDRSAGGTSQASQFERMNWRFGAFASTERGNVGKASRPVAITCWCVSNGTHSLQDTP